MVDGVFRLLFETAPHPYLVLRADETFTIVAVNERYLGATGTERAAILDRGLFEVFPDNPGNSTATGVGDLRASLERVKRERAADVMGVQKYDIPRPGSQGEFEVKYWSPVNTPVCGPDGSLLYIIHHVEDVTDFYSEPGAGCPCRRRAHRTCPSPGGPHGGRGAPPGQ